MTGHKTTQMVRIYIQEANLFKNNALNKIKIIFCSKNYLQLGCLTFLLTSFIPLLPSGAFFGDYNLTIFWINLSIMYAAENKTNIFRLN